MDDPRKLQDMLHRINDARARREREDHSELEILFDRPSTRLAIYGSLAPGEVNHWVIEDIGGTWSDGHVRGTVRMKGWGSHVGFPGMTWIPDSDERVPVKLLASEGLPEQWERIDAFEGGDYVRILVPVEIVDGAPVVANIYQLRVDPAADD
jgi:gamma-glutamylcyclotransferase (GGCT)/AIG2-like uncharacterized protein YtfP